MFNKSTNSVVVSGVKATKSLWSKLARRHKNSKEIIDNRLIIFDMCVICGEKIFFLARARSVFMLMKKRKNIFNGK